MKPRVLLSSQLLVQILLTIFSANPTTQTSIYKNTPPKRVTVYKYLANLVLLTHPIAGTSRLPIKLTLFA
jgi:hypothetical protein